MWNSKRSVKLSLYCNRIIMALVVAVTVIAATPFGIGCITLFSLPYPGGIDYYPSNIYYPYIIIGICYLCCAAALLALFNLDRLLTNIKIGDVFIRANVKALRIISWCCFAEAVFLIAAALGLTFLFFAISAMAGFIGLILRVVKNVIEAAVILKEENDLTI